MLRTILRQIAAIFSFKMQYFLFEGLVIVIQCRIGPDLHKRLSSQVALLTGTWLRPKKPNLENAQNAQNAQNSLKPFSQLSNRD
jgi:hypothetical protein